MRHLLLVSALSSIAAVATVAAPASAATDASRQPAGREVSAGIGFIEELDASDSIENRGFTYGARHKNVDSAFCFGLKYAPYRRGSWGLNRYSQLKCQVSAADDHYYSMRFVMIGPRAYVLRQIKLEF